MPRVDAATQARTETHHQITAVSDENITTSGWTPSNINCKKVIVDSE